MKSKKQIVSTVQGTVVTPTASVNADMFALFQQFMAMQNAPVNVVPPVKSNTPVKKVAKTAPVKAEKAPAKTVEKTGVHIHELANSFFVYGEQAPAKLAAFFARKPHLDRGFKERAIDGIGNVKAYWFGGRQIAKVKKELAK